jgi:dipeptidyl aminopeptidase/acylaminoacyl peptidase
LTENERVKYFTIKNDNNDDMNVKMVVPVNFDGSGQTKYSVLFEVYGGPYSQKVQQKYGIGGFAHDVTSSNVIFVNVDGRGTGFKGRKYFASVSKRLGYYEVLDQIAAAKWFSKQKYVNAKNIGIWGWSYGGYVTLKVLEADSGVFSLGMAVAPVTDWRYYDSMYTERYMKTPETNPQGYEESRVSKMQGFRHAKLLLCHGTADDNVHFQHSANFIWDLTGAGIKDYSVQVYTDSNHSMDANHASSLIFEKLRSFMCAGFGLKCN